MNIQREKVTNLNCSQAEICLMLYLYALYSNNKHVLLNPYILNFTVTIHIYSYSFMHTYIMIFKNFKHTRNVYSVISIHLPALWKVFAYICCVSFSSFY